MRLRVPLAVALLAVLAVAAIAQSASSDADRAELQRLETVWNEAHMHGDLAAIEPLWADDLEVAVPRMPIITKADAENVFKSGRIKFSRYETSDLKIRTYGDSAVVTGRLQRTRTMNGREVNDDWRFTKMYAKQAGRWRVVSFHASEAAQP